MNSSKEVYIRTILGQKVDIRDYQKLYEEGAYDDQIPEQTGGMFLEFYWLDWKSGYNFYDDPPKGGIVNYVEEFDFSKKRKLTKEDLELIEKMLEEFENKWYINYGRTTKTNNKRTIGDIRVSSRTNFYWN